MDSVELQQLRQSSSRQANSFIPRVAQVGRFSRNRRNLISMKNILIGILLIICVIVSIGFTVTYVISKTSAVDEYKAIVNNNNEEYGFKAPVFRKPNVDDSYDYKPTVIKPSVEDTYKSTTRNPSVEDTFKSTVIIKPNAEDVKVQPRNKYTTSQLRFMKQIMPGLDVSIDPCTDFYQFACGKYNWTDENALVTSHLFNGTLEILKILLAPSTFTDIAALNYAKSYFRSCVVAKILAGSGLQFHRLYLTKYISSITENVFRIEQKFGLLHRNGINTLLKISLIPVNQTLIAIEISVNKMFGKMLQEIIHEDYELKISDIFLLQFAVEFVEALKEINAANEMDESFTSTGTTQGDVVGNDKVHVMTSGELINKLSKTTGGNTNGTLVNKFNWKLFLLSMLPAGTFLSDYVFLVRHEQLLKAIVKVFAQKQVDEAFLILQEFTVKIYLMEENEVSDDDRDQFYFSEMKWKAFAANNDNEASSFISNQLICAHETNSFFGMAIGLKYMENNRQFFKVTTEASTLAKNLRLQFLKGIESIQWLNPESRSKLMEKVNNISFTFGDVKRKREEVVRYYNHFDFGTQTATYYQKKVKIHASMFQTLVKELPKLKSVEFPMASGAVYITFVNNIYVSANMINLFLGKNEFKSMNYGGMGFVLGHEIIHSVDSDSIGNRYSNVYNLSSEAIQSYEEKVNCFLNRFNSSQNNGNATLAENIADAGGLSLSLKAYNTYIDENGPENDLHYLPYTAAQLFFMGFAQFHCSPIPLHGDGIHSYPKLRVLGTLQNTMEFYEAYNCPVPSNHNFCKIW